MTATRGTVLIVEDDPGLQSQMRWCMPDDLRTEVAADRNAAEALIRRIWPEVMTLDLGLPPDPGGSSEGFAVLETALRLNPAMKVIVITGREENELALQAVAAGAFDFYQKPIDDQTLRFIVERALRINGLEAEIARLRRLEKPVIEGIIASSEPMQAVLRDIQKIASTNVSVLIRGETGTGKELIARALHGLSGRAERPFVAINCAAIPENLLETELFGHEKGAFTGAVSRKRGKIEEANGGTLLLDEIGDMPAALQAKMLRFLQEHSFERIGGTQAIGVDVRVVSATHRDLSAEITAQRFREDLYYRLAEITITLPPLRERGDDALLIARSLLDTFAEQHNRGPIKLSARCADAIRAWHWPGNVRELENRLKRAVVLTDERYIEPADLEIPEVEGPARPAEQPTLRQIREQAERSAILSAMAMNDHSVSRAARQLGVSRPTLYALMKRYGMRGDEPG